MNHFPHPKGVKLDNLLRMADYIENVPEDKFSMRFYRGMSDGKSHECNSVGCIIGHCVILDDFSNLSFRYIDGTIKFRLWSYQFTGISIFFPEWDYIFSTDWEIVDNTPKGAAKRLRYYVKNGLPYNWEEQLKGFEPLSYNQ